MVEQSLLVEVPIAWSVNAREPPGRTRPSLEIDKLERICKVRFKAVYKRDLRNAGQMVVAGQYKLVEAAIRGVMDAKIKDSGGTNNYIVEYE